MTECRAWWMVSMVLAVVALLAVPGPASAGYRVGPNVQVWNDPLWQGEAAIAVNPADDRNVIAESNTLLPSPSGAPCPFSPTSKDCFLWLDIYTSRDGGKSWRTQLFPKSGVTSGFDQGGDPSVAFDRQGRAYAHGFFWHNNEKFINGAHEGSIAVTRSDDGGTTWNDPVIAVPGQGGAGHVIDYGKLAADVTGGAYDGNVYLSWEEGALSSSGGNGHTVWVSTSRDHGQSWQAVQVNGKNPAGDSRAAQYSDVIAVGPNGEVYVLWDEIFKDNNVVQQKFWMATSLDGGATFSDPRVVQEGIPQDEAFVSMAVDTGSGSHRGRIYAAWHDTRSGNADIYLISSDDGGTWWSSPLRVNADGGTATQYKPWISVGPSGRVDIAFYDRRNDPNDTLNDRYYAGSTDGGLTFTNVRASDTSWDPTFVPFDDFDQIASTKGAAYLVWADGRNNVPAGTNLDIYFAAVSA